MLLIVSARARDFALGFHSKVLLEIAVGDRRSPFTMPRTCSVRLAAMDIHCVG